MAGRPGPAARQGSSQTSLAARKAGSQEGRQLGSHAAGSHAGQKGQTGQAVRQPGRQTSSRQPASRSFPSTIYQKKMF